MIFPFNAQISALLLILFLPFSLFSTDSEDFSRWSEIELEKEIRKIVQEDGLMGNRSTLINLFIALIEGRKKPQRAALISESYHVKEYYDVSLLTYLFAYLAQKAVLAHHALFSQYEKEKSSQKKPLQDLTQNYLRQAINTIDRYKQKAKIVAQALIFEKSFFQELKKKLNAGNLSELWNYIALFSLSNITPLKEKKLEEKRLQKELKKRRDVRLGVGINFFLPSQSQRKILSSELESVEANFKATFEPNKYKYLLNQLREKKQKQLFFRRARLIIGLIVGAALAYKIVHYAFTKPEATSLRQKIIAAVQGGPHAMQNLKNTLYSWLKS